MRRLFCLLLALAFAGAAVGAPDTHSLPALHRIVGSDGLGISTIRRSDLEALWGRADIEKQMTPSSSSSERRPWALLEYKSRGLLFTTTVGSYGTADPPIDTAYFSEPFDGCTPQGLCIGMPQDTAMAIITAHYKITGDYAVTFDQGGRFKGRSYTARNQGWRKTHTMSFGFSEGRLHAMSFRLQPTPLIAWRTVKGVIAWTLLITLVVGGTLVLRPYRRQLAPVWKAVKVGFALYALATVGMAIFVIYILFKR
jgi:hypothetical protein